MDEGWEHVDVTYFVCACWKKIERGMFRVDMVSIEFPLI